MFPEIQLDEILSKVSILGIAGNKSSGKSMLMWGQAIFLKEKYPGLDIYVLGAEQSLFPFLEKKGVTILRSKSELLDLRIKDAVIFVDEFACLFETKAASKQREKLEKFFDRVEHLNVKIVFGSAREGYFNKFLCSRLTVVLALEIEYESLVQGTWFRERAMNIVGNTSDYRLDCERGCVYLVSYTPDFSTKKFSFRYIKELDSKAGNKNLFANPVKKGRKK